MDLTISMRPDPAALVGINPQARSLRLAFDRRRRIPYRLQVIDAEMLKSTIAISPEWAVRRLANGRIFLCGNRNAYVVGRPRGDRIGWGLGHRARSQAGPTAVSVYIDEALAPEGWFQFDALAIEDLALIEFIPRMAMLRVYTKRFMSRLDRGRMGLMPFWIN